MLLAYVLSLYYCQDIQYSGVLCVPFVAVFEVVFWCHVLPFLKSCSDTLTSTPFSSMGESSAFSTILLRYKASNRYLCMDKSGKIYSLPLPVRKSTTNSLKIYPNTIHRLPLLQFIP